MTENTNTDTENVESTEYAEKFERSESPSDISEKELHEAFLAGWKEASEWIEKVKGDEDTLRDLGLAAHQDEYDATYPASGSPNHIHPWDIVYYYAQSKCYGVFLKELKKGKELL